MFQRITTHFSHLLFPFSVKGEQPPWPPSHFLPAFSLYWSSESLQQLETQVLRLELGSRLPSGLRGGEDSGDSKARAGTWDGAGTGVAIRTGEMEAGAVLKEAPGDSGTTAPPPPPPPLPSLASLSWSKWMRAACWALRVAERWAGSELKPAVSCSTRCSRDNIWRSKSSLRSLSSDMSSYMTLCIYESRRDERKGQWEMTQCTQRTLKKWDRLHIRKQAGFIGSIQTGRDRESLWKEGKLERWIKWIRHCTKKMPKREKEVEGRM